MNIDEKIEQKISEITSLIKGIREVQLSTNISPKGRKIGKIRMKLKKARYEYNNLKFIKERPNFLK